MKLAFILRASLAKLHPAVQIRNPVMFVVYISAWLTTIISLIEALFPTYLPYESLWFAATISLWLWITIIFASTAETIAERKGKALADSLRAMKRDLMAKKIKHPNKRGDVKLVQASTLEKNDIILVEEGDFVPADGMVVDGIATVDESAITGESAPVIRESGGEANHVTAGTRLLSDWLVVKVDQQRGDSFLDKMIGLVETAKRQKTPNEISLSIMLTSFAIGFLITAVTLLPFLYFSEYLIGKGDPASLTLLIALLVCLSPTTVGGLLSTIGVAGINRLLRANVIAYSGRAVEAAGDVSVLLLDKTGTITYGNRQAEAFIPAEYVSVMTLAEAALFSSLSDHTPEGRSIAQLAREKYNIIANEEEFKPSELIEFTAETRCSGVLLDGRKILKGAADAIEDILNAAGGSISRDVQQKIESVAKRGGTPLVVIDGSHVLGVVHLKDVIKSGIKVRLADLRKMGIRSVMITGDNPITAAAIAIEAGVDDYIAKATPETKLLRIRKMQAEGEVVAMVGDGSNDAPALAQSDVAIVMQSGTQAAKDAGNMVDLDSDPTKLIEIVEIGKQMLMTRGAFTTFSMANDISKFFAIIPTAFISTYPALEVLNVMQLTSPHSAMLSAIIFNALIIAALIPLALRGVTYKAISTAVLLRRNLFIYGIGGLIAPFIGIKLIDMLLTLMGAV